MEDLLFAVECDEPKNGKVIRNVYNVSLTPQNIEKLWHKAKKFKHIMGWEIPTYEKFILYFVRPTPSGGFQSNGILARIDDFVGIFWLTDIDLQNNRASIHYTFFDKYHRGRVNLCRAAIKHVFTKYGFDEIWTMVPLYMRQPKKEYKYNKEKMSVLDFVEKIGFRKINRLKDRIVFEGHTFDANLYSLSREEVVTNDLFSKLEEKENGQRESGLLKSDQHSSSGIEHAEESVVTTVQ